MMDRMYRLYGEQEMDILMRKSLGKLRRWILGRQAVKMGSGWK
jgi:hypothetical protein